MTSTKRTCEERIQTEALQTEKWADQLQRLLDTDIEAAEETGAYEELQPLSVTRKLVVVIQLSWGGPSSWLEAELTPDAGNEEIDTLTYHFANWFDHAKRPLAPDDFPALWSYATRYVQFA